MRKAVHVQEEAQVLTGLPKMIAGSETGEPRKKEAGGEKQPPLPMQIDEKTLKVRKVISP